MFLRNYDEWYEISNDDFFICPVCENTCTKEEIYPQLEENKTP